MLQRHVNVAEITHVRAFEDDLSRCRALVLLVEPHVLNDADGADDEAGSDTGPETGPIFRSTEMNVSIRLLRISLATTYS